MQMIRKKQRLWKAYKRTGKVEDYYKYKNALKETTNEIRKSMLNFERKLTVRFPLRTSEVNKRSDMVGPLKDNNGIVKTNDKEMADAINIYFSSMFTLADQPVYNQPLLADNVECLTNMLITPAMIVTT